MMIYLRVQSQIQFQTSLHYFKTKKNREMGLYCQWFTVDSVKFSHYVVTLSDMYYYRRQRPSNFHFQELFFSNLHMPTNFHGRQRKPQSNLLRLKPTIAKAPVLVGRSLCLLSLAVRETKTILNYHCSSYSSKWEALRIGLPPIPPMIPHPRMIPKTMVKMESRARLPILVLSQKERRSSLSIALSYMKQRFNLFFLFSLTTHVLPS